MRILFLDAYFEPEQIAFTHLENDLLEGLVNAGHEVEIVCPTPTRGVSAEIVRDYKNKKQESLYNGHVHVTRFSAPQEGKNPIVRALRYFWCNLRTYQIGKRAKNIDAVFANSTPPTQGWIAGKVSKKLRVPFIYSLQDVFPDSLVNAGMIVKNSLIWKIGRVIENKTYEKADRIITISNSFSENIIRKGVPISKIMVVPNWINTDDVFPISREDNRVLERYSLDSCKYYVCYSGNIGHSQNFDLLIRVAKRIQKELPYVSFVIIGDGVAKEHLQDEISRNRLNNIFLLPFQPYEDIAHVFSLGDVGLIISKPGVGGSSVPSKTWSIMAAERPILASFDKNSDLINLISETKSGVFANANDEEGLINAISWLYTNKKDADNMGKNGREFVRINLSKEYGTKRYIDTIISTLK